MKTKTLPVYDLQFHKERLASGPADPDCYTGAELAIWNQWHRRAILSIRRAKRLGRSAPENLVITVKDYHDA